MHVCHHSAFWNSAKTDSVIKWILPVAQSACASDMFVLTSCTNCVQINYLRFVFDLKGALFGETEGSNQITKYAI